MADHEVLGSQAYEQQSLLGRMHNLGEQVVNSVQSGFDRLTSSHVALAATGALAVGGAGIAEAVIDTSPAGAAQYQTRVIHKTSKLNNQTIIDQLERALPFNGYTFASEDHKLSVTPNSAFLEKNEGGFTSTCNINPRGDFGGIAFGYKYFDVGPGNMFKAATCNFSQSPPLSKVFFPALNHFQKPMSRISEEISHSVGIKNTETVTRIGGNRARIVATYARPTAANATKNYITKMVMTSETKDVAGKTEKYSNITITEEHLG